MYLRELGGGEGEYVTITSFKENTDSLESDEIMSSLSISTVLLKLIIMQL